MKLIEYIKNILSKDKRKMTRIVSEDLTKTIGAADKYYAAVYTEDKSILHKGQVTFQINNKAYVREIDQEGVASLNINLGLGKYNIITKFQETSEYQPATETNTITVKPDLEAHDFNMQYLDGSKYEVRPLTNDKTPIPNLPVIIKVNEVMYKRTTDQNGVADLQLNLRPGTYPISAECYNARINNTVSIVKATTRMEGTDINKTKDQQATYQCAIYNLANNRLIGAHVELTVNGKTYNRVTDVDGLAKININLDPGLYDIKAEFKGDYNYLGSVVQNKIVVGESKKSRLRGYLKTQGCNGIGQCTPYYCACNSLQQSFYRLTGINVPESQIAKVAGTTSSGTSHGGINTAVNWFNREYKQNVTINWLYFSDLGNDASERWNKLAGHCTDGAVFCHLLYRNKWGHYEVLESVNKDTVTVLNSLGNKCGSTSYCGYVETRSKANQLSYMNGISQASVAYLTN